jgi:hypothetical protein
MTQMPLRAKTSVKLLWDRKASNSLWDLCF